MIRAITALVAVTWLALLAVAPARAQNFPSVGFRNDTKAPLIIQGYSITNGVHRRGPPLLVVPGRSTFDVQVPPGPRFYTIYDANQPTRVYLRDFPLVLRGDVLLAVRPSTTGPAHVDLFPDGP